MLKIKIVEDSVTSFVKDFTNHVLPVVIPGRIGNILLQDIMHRFRREVDIEGNPWQPLSKKTIERRPKKSEKILQSTGQMIGSLHVVPGMGDFTTAVAMSKYDYMFNINVPKLQHEGGTGYILEPDGTVTKIEVPARPLMGASLDAIEEIQALPGEMYP